MKKRQLISSVFETYRNELLRFIVSKYSNSQDAEDIVQDAFHNIIKSDNVNELENPRAYLYQTASNLALNRIRKEKKHSEYASEVIVDEDEMSSSLEQSHQASKDLEKIEHALKSLPEKCKQTFILSRVHAKTYTEISLELGIAVSTVEKHIIKTLRYLRDHLDEDTKL